ncbi:MAG: hypothetical protein JKX97_07855, partial [Candidatus Lindowbacteria bacterium]|nr:hypothetical protein [Candidatus Lindowbacteria bacterium]
MSDTPQNSGISNEPRLSLIDFYTRIIFFIALQLVLCHFFLPDYTWGQGRGSYFILTNRLSLGSWFTSILLLITSGFCLTLYLKNTQNKIWISGAVLLLLLSFFEFSRFGDKSGWIQLDVVRKDGSIEWMYFFRLSYIAIISTPLLAYFISRIRTSVKLNSATKTALTGWGITWALSIAFNILALGQLLGFSDLTIGLARGSTHLMGTVFLFYLLGSLLDPECELIAPVPDVGDLEPPSRTAQLIMVGGAAFIVIFLEIILFRIFLIHGNYVPANYALSIDLPGLATGVLAGHYVVKNRRTDIASTAAILLPASIIFSLGPASYAGDWPVVSALFLTFPFACASLFITIGLSYSPSNLIYGIELLGAGLAVFAVNPTLVQVREEGSFLVLGALAALVGACWFFSIRKLRKRSLSLGISMLLFVIGFLLLAQLNQNTDTVNIVREKILLKYPDGRVFFSKSTLVGRVDIGQSNREKHSIKNYENGRVIDTLRPYPRENYTIDPRLPHNMIDSPSVFIIGLAGEGITKTATNIGREVIGVEINPATVELMTENIAPYAHNIYDGIDVEILDGRTYLMRSDKKFDYITVLNTHFARGSTPGRAASAEYLHTVEAFSLYLDHLTDSGFIDIEEPANRLHHEAPIWKTLVTLRETLLRNGITNPEKHFLLFQWVTKTNRYIQIFVKRTPVTPLDLEKFNVWMSQIDQLGDIEKKEGRRMGPLHGARTEVLYSPDREYSNNYAHAINGTLTPTLIKKFVLNPSTDDRPFTYFVNPSAPGLRSAYSSVLILSLPLLLMIFLQLKKEKADSLLVNNYAAAAALSGFGYLFIELALIQKFQLLLGSPVVALAVVLGGMLIFSGVGSLLSNRVGLRGVAVTVGAISLYIPTLYASLPYLLTHFATADFTTRVAVSTFSIAPLAMLMGIPLAYLIRESRDHVGTTSGALMYAINSVAGALAVPLTLNLSTSYGFIGTALFASASYFGMVLLFATLQSPHLKKPGLMLALGLIGILITIPWHRS